MRIRREWVLVTAAGAVVVAGLGTAVARHGPLMVFDLVTAAMFVVAGAVVRRDPSQQRTGALLLAAGVLPVLQNAWSIVGDWGNELASVVKWSAVLPIAIVLATYPGVAVQRPWHRWLLTAIGADLVGLWGVALLLWNPARDGSPEPNHWATLWDAHPVFLVLWHIAWAGGVLLPLAGVVVFAQRWHSAQGPTRTAVRSVSAIGIVLALTLSAWFVTGLIGPGGWWHLLSVDLADTMSNITLVLLAVAPVGLLIEALRRRAAQLRLVDELLAAENDPQAARAVLRSALDDRSLQLAIPTAEPDGPGWLAVTDDGLTPCDEPPQLVPGRSRREIRSQGGQLLAVVDTADTGPTQDGHVRTVLAGAAVVLENIQLHASLLARLAELRHSRARIVEAGLVERRRVERDLHDGAQQLLLSVASSLGRIEVVGDDALARGSALDDARAQLSEALAELRRLARGIHPAVLTQAGLDAALRSLADSCPVYPILDVEAGLRTARFAPAVEATVWFVAAEAVSNVVKHAQATCVHIGLIADGENLVLTIRDDGRGGTVARPDGGLAGLMDRVGALGGRLAIAAAPARGTVVTAVVPCGS